MATSTESDVQQERQRVKAKAVVAKEPPSAPVKTKRVQSKPKQRTAASTIGTERKRGRSHSATESESDCEQLRRSPRKRQVTNISTENGNTAKGQSTSQPNQRTAESTSAPQPPMTSPAKTIDHLSSGDVLTSQRPKALQKRHC